jgi:MATE family multidrug resistance protein
LSAAGVGTAAVAGWRAQLWSSARRLVPLAWPVFVGQASVLGFGTVDTLLVARTTTADLAALAVGAAAFVSIFIGSMGVLLGLSPIVGQFYGARRLEEAGHQARQALFLVLGLALLGSTLLAFPQPFLALAHASPEVALKVRGYLGALALSLPASLLFTVYRSFNTAVSRPLAVMLLQLGGLALKVPLSMALVFGLPAIGLPGLGVVGCGIATCLAMWTQVGVATLVIHRDPFYAPFRLTGRGALWPDWKALKQHLRLGLPTGASVLVEVTGFSFMAIFIARLGATSVAGHQLVTNLVSLMFMMPLAMANATGTLVAQSLGASRSQDAHRIAWHGLIIGCAVAGVVGLTVLLGREPILRGYTGDPAVIAAALPLMTWVALFHLADAAQTIAAGVLRAYKIATVPLVIYVASMWGVGQGGGYLLAFDTSGWVPQALHGAAGYWTASTVAITLAGGALCGFMAFVLKQPRPSR